MGTDLDGLVVRARSGDRDALDALWRLSRRWVAGVLVAHAPAGSDTADLGQDVAMALVRGIASLDRPAAFRTWLRCLAINVARDAARRISRSRAATVDGAAFESIADPKRDGSVGGEERILEHLRELPEAYREPLVLRAIDGLSLADISSILDLPLSTLETRLARARRQLRDLLIRAEVDTTIGRDIR